ncbi:hypothetical protein VNI00_011075 [Paramarasmius palmivorus]|uniref:Polysaccharide lyase 14 domain-containing protein n=1 Tax=Paramarasmius palmivorus TaxID=297713 RepID=A0AAW0CDA4_9AGAR
MIPTMFLICSALGAVLSLSLNETLLSPLEFPLSLTTTTFVTETVTVIVTPSSTVLPSTAQPSSTSPPSSTSWISPSNISDISSAFNVTKFSDNQKNLQVVDEGEVPAEANARLFMEGTQYAQSFLEVLEEDDSSGSSVLQVLYPEGSINPANSPRGGAQFYASPLDITNATNVTFTYSILFPEDFDFVKGGKLPGLYGGRTGCSGGDAAVTCFSTRLMWRAGGQGELYLYSPKDKQTKDLCDDNHSVCDAAYGLSIGRGSFKFAPGKWTRLSQTVTLNTPGEQDGSFTLDVDGEQVIDRKDVFYRDNLGYGPESTGKKSRDGKSRGTQVKTPNPAHHQIGTGPLGLGGLLRREDPTLDELFIQDGDEAFGTQESTSNDGPVGFKGIFFRYQSCFTVSCAWINGFDSTFFGGHESEWASPRDQYVWFKNFSMSCNA